MPNNVYDDGKEFTDILVTADSATTTPGVDPHNAAISCRGLGSEWFLPAGDELSQIYTNRNVGDFNGTFDLSGSLPTGYYWSSSETNNNGAWAVRLSDDDLHYDNKPSLFSVRCIRR